MKIYKLLVLFCLLQLNSLSFVSFAHTINQDKIPPEVKKALINSGLPDSAIAFSIVRLSKNDGHKPLLTWQPHLAMNPASTMKLLTTMSALDILGPQYRWKTNIFTNGLIDRGLLKGDLILQGTGDPKFVPEELSNIMSNLRQLGIEKIDGNLIFDRSAYNSNVKSTAPGDGELSRSYNVAPDPLLYAFQTISFNITHINGKPDITYTPRLSQLKIDNRIIQIKTPCNDWGKLLKMSVIKNAPEEWTASFVGKFSTECGEVHWNIVALNPNDFLKQGILASWEDAGGLWVKAPNVIEASVPSNSKLLLSHQGIQLSDAVKDINKFSNNVMARQLFLTLALEKSTHPASTYESSRVIKNWLQQLNLDMANLVLENGAGLSNIERITPDEMTQLLIYSVKSKYRDIFLSSLPIAGVDGTMKHRLLDVMRRFLSNPSSIGQPIFKPDPLFPQALQQPGALIKTGTLSNVRSIAGYVVSQSGQVYAISSMINHPKAAGGLSVQDALLSWVIKDGMDR